MQIYYLNTTQNIWYDALGEQFRDGLPSMAFQSRENIRIITVVDSPNAGTETVDPANDWQRDQSWSGCNAIITVDNDYLHKIKSATVTAIAAGSTLTEIQIAMPSGVSASSIPETGTVRLFDAAGDAEEIHYTARTIVDGIATFIVDHVAEKDYPAGSVADCPQAPYCYARLDAENSDPQNGVFEFYLVVDSLRLREEMLYNSTANLPVQGLELLFYRETAAGSEPVRAFLLSSFQIVGTIGDVNYSADLPESDAIKQINDTIYTIVAAGHEVQLSTDNETWVDYAEIAERTDVWLYYRFRLKAAGGDWSPGVPLIEGKQGDSAYEVAVDAGFDGTEEEWLASLVGPAGVGKSAYEVAVDAGFDGTEEEWLATLIGPTGEGMNYDASGSLQERPLYDDEPAGFVFAVAVAEPEKFLTTLYLYKKMSDTSGDWSEPLTIVFFGSDDPEITAVMPVSFGAMPENALYFAIDASSHPAAVVTQVTIDTDAGELILPYGSDAGIKKIIKNAGKWYIYFGSVCPPFTSGKVYFSQMVNAVKSSGGAVIEGKIYYGYLPSTETFQRLIDITTDMLDASTLKSIDSAPTGGVVLGNVPAGTFTVALVPYGVNNTVTKDDGFGGKVAFAEDNGFAGTGANGLSVTLGQVQYRLYGEFNLVPGYTKIYFD